MLVIEKVSNGRTIVVFKRDWYAGNIGRAYNPNKNFVDSRDMEKLQSALLVKRPIFTA